MKKPNEIDALQCLLKILPYITGGEYRHRTSPDDHDSTEKEVDFLLAPTVASLPPIAVEHTVLEAFRGQRTYILDSYEDVEAVNGVVEPPLPKIGSSLW